LKALLLQKEHPPMPTLPSLLGHVNPALTDTFWIRFPKFLLHQLE
jgi:hypothetical protein